MDIMSLASTHVRGLEAYESPDWEELASRAGISPDRLIRLDANENYYSPSPRVADALALSLIHISEPTRQPATSRMPSSA